ncbi:MAG TPA: MFS transporter [Nitrososphaerales archaeon]|nr:MFS transporter [Nitrososphaerales archaeon]
MEVDSPGILGLSRALFLNRNIRIIAITGLVSGVYIGMLNVVLQLFPLSLGFGVAAVGILQALGNRFSGVAATIVQPIAGHYSDVHSRKQSILLGSAATIMSMLSFVGAALTANGFLLLLAFILFGVSILGSPASQALVAESVDLDPKRMNVAYSLVFFLATIPGIISSYLAGAIADNYGYVAIFAAAALLEGADLYLYWRELSETKHAMITDSTDGRSFSLREAFRLPKASAGYYGALATDAFALDYHLHHLRHGKVSVPLLRREHRLIGVGIVHRDARFAVSCHKTSDSDWGQEDDYLLGSTGDSAHGRVGAFQFPSRVRGILSRLWRLRYDLGTRGPVPHDDPFASRGTRERRGQGGSFQGTGGLPGTHHRRVPLPGPGIRGPYHRQLLGDDRERRIDDQVPPWTSAEIHGGGCR